MQMRLSSIANVNPPLPFAVPDLACFLARSNCPSQSGLLRVEAYETPAQPCGVSGEYPKPRELRPRPASIWKTRSAAGSSAGDPTRLRNGAPELGHPLKTRGIVPDEQTAFPCMSETCNH